jgi:Kef-type K+ transport system membrane component KefB
MDFSDARFVFEFALIVLAAKAAGRLSQKVLRQPAVIGELLVGGVMGPYALGRFSLLSMGPAFPTGADGLFHEWFLRGITIAGIVTMLFTAGLETDLRSFLRFAPKGMMVGLGGLLLGFAAAPGQSWRPGGGPVLPIPESWPSGPFSAATSISLAARVCTT